MSKLLPKTKGGVPWLHDRLIYLTVHGSRAYGTSTPTSDLDLKGVAIPPREYFHGYLNQFAQAEFDEPDAVVYGIQKFMKLAADCNPNIIEVLWTDPSDHVYMTPMGEMLLEHREDFLSKKAKHTFSGYAMSQLKRIRSHREWLLNPAEEEPKREDFGLPTMAKLSREQLGAVEKHVRQKVDEWEVDWDVVPYSERLAFRGAFENALIGMSLGTEEERWISAARQVGLEENFLELILRERRYRGARNNWKQYHEWKRNRNPGRAKTEAEFGLDLKHAAHLVRLMRMGEEILTTGKVIVKRPDAEELLAIRNGAWEYDDLIEWAERKDSELTRLYKESDVLPRQPDRKKLDELCTTIVEEALKYDSFTAQATERGWAP